ncbi:MAG: sel1 repeat family protein, partial [Deltaproteobacteria bacterium]|nr:sel1 repeat family protein [Deltaproteobacteria bacterium]
MSPTTRKAALVAAAIGLAIILWPMALLADLDPLMIRDALNGDPEAQFKMAKAYDLGTGVPQDDAKALEWYEKAAGNGNDSAMFNLGVIHHLGLNGIEADAGKAALWYGKAVEKGNTNALSNLGQMYETGSDS